MIPIDREPGEGPPARVLVVADDPLARSALRERIDRWPKIEIASAAAPADVDAALDAWRPDVVLWDAGWSPEHDQWSALLEVLVDIGAEGVPVVVLVTPDSAAGEVWAAGAAGVVDREAPMPVVVSALGAALAGLRVVDPDLASVGPALSGAPVEPLTPRELQVLRYVAEGLTNRAIAARLEISTHTVKFHLNNLTTKLQAASRTEAVVRATRLGLLRL